MLLQPAFGQLPHLPPMQNETSEPQLSLAALLSLPQQADLAAIQTLLRQSPQIRVIDCPISKPELRQFIVWALQQSQAGELTAEEKLKLLDIAWEVQNLLWQHR